MDTTSSSESKKQILPDLVEGSWLTKLATTIIWVELILGLSAISSAVFLNPRVPVFLYAIYGFYFATFLWLLYSTCRSAHLQRGPIKYLYWIFGGCTLATAAVVVLTFVTSPNSGEIAFISTIVFLVSLVLFPFVSALFYCFLRGNLVLPIYMQAKTPVPLSSLNQDETDDSTAKTKKQIEV